jgi:von Willebrand factor type A domain-containing protein
MTFVLLALALASPPAVSAASGVPAVSAPAKRPPALSEPGPRVEVAFVLDTTGSMGGLIDGAKRRIWSIARRIGEGRPRPDLRIALVAYRDLGDAYVTRTYDFMSDMDEVFGHLSEFRAEGGGDTPEHVSAAMHDAVHRLTWSSGPALRMIILVGDAPPHMDYQDGFDYRRHVREARQRGIVVESIQCGADPQTAQVWREIASAGGGEYAQIDGQGGMPVRVTPVDAELARLNSELASTVVVAGTAAERQATETRLAARRGLAAPVAAEAAGYYGARERLAEHDLVDLPAAEQAKALPAAPALQGKTEKEALQYLKDQKARRDALQGRIQVLTKQREEMLAASAPADSFDEKVVGALMDQAKKQGVR